MQDALVDTVSVHTAMYSVDMSTVLMVMCSVVTATVHMVMCSVRTATVRMVKCSVRTVTVRTAIDYIDYSTVVPGQPAVNFPPALELTAVNTLTAPVSVAVNSPTEQLLHNADKKPSFHHTVCRKMYIA